MNVGGIILGVCIPLGSVLTYIPQFHTIIKNKSVTGISELSLVLSNIGMMFLTLNSIIFSWNYFYCNCFSNLLPFFQILISWIMLLIYYIIFIFYKFKHNRKNEKRILSGLHYCFTYILFAIFVTALAIGEKFETTNTNFFIRFATVLGFSSAIINSIVYLPQIYLLLKNKNSGSLSFTTFALQTPGNLLIIFFQAYLYSSPVSTWITYVVALVEQTLILCLMLYYNYYNLPQETTEEIF